jgi:hypothetical protein
VGQGIDQRKGRAPTAAKCDEAVDLKLVADGFDILHQMPGRVRLNAGMRA